ncbi:MAG: hypothetical protein IJ097_00305 [Bacilli bacterium]|nr:hypothetical protein [Bacilli bacterium]
MKIDLEKIKEIYGENTIYQLKENIENVSNNISFLSSLGFDDVINIFENSPYMFLYTPTIFKRKVNALIDKLGVEYIEKLDNDISLWGDLDG